jgi:EAL domain-containing protein (putative c-di-GMP-specific phosphodiesterase class I)
VLAPIQVVIMVFSTLYYATLTYSGKTYVYDVNSIALTHYFDVYILFGLFAAFACLVITFINREHVIKIVMSYISFFVPLDALLLIVQYIYSQTEFISLTYTMPFVIFYILFHSNPYDEITGCQSSYSFETQFIHARILRRNYMIVAVITPKGQILDYSFLKEQVPHIAADKCRKIEKIASGIHVYCLNNYNYAFFIKNPTTERSEYIIRQIREIMESPTKYAINNDSITYKMIVFHNHPFIDSTLKLGSMQHFLFEKLGTDLKSECYIAKDSDYDEFVTSYQIETILYDIKDKKNLDDERVICYAQPIYCVETKSFRTAEALMRLNLNGKIITPDKFIPIAEQNGCIHSLTCIILNKVCKMISQFENTCDFDAVTVNCSALEFSSTNFHYELLQIISHNKISCSKIRLELTESAMSGDYDVLIKNVQRLRDAGVQFYLDDFGTGYSNLERILGCPFKTIKFDKSLLYKSMDDSRMDDLIVSMAHVFKKQGFDLLVEGVETDEQTQYCINRGFTYLQGYKYAKPQPIEVLPKYFQSL